VNDAERGVPGALHPRAALRHDPLFTLLRSRLESPVLLGVVLAMMALVAIVFGASDASRFIYTDF